MSSPILSVRDLTVRYKTKEATIFAVQDASFELAAGKVLALVGESGSGKTTAGLSLLRLLPPEAEVVSGEAIFEGVNLLDLDERSLRAMRGRKVAMVFQDPVAGLNPVLSVGDQVAEILTNHLQIHKKEAKKHTHELLYSVGMADPERVAKSYPFQLSGGMCQRVMIAIATALDPALLIADEPTSSLDVTVQAQILRQLDILRETRGTAILLITHDFGVVAQMADDVAVMYAGRVVETGDAVEVMKRPLHPYSAGLLAARPRLDGTTDGPLPSIPGHLPEAAEPAEHCPFIPRCTKVMNVCRNDPPPVLTRHGEDGHRVACYNPMWQG
jgi:peptide/nickel transport system ATP-binding protein